MELAVANDFLGGAVRLWWSLLEPAARTSRAEYGTGIYEHFEWFAGECARVAGARGSTPADAYDRQRLIASNTQRIAVILARIAEMEAMRTVTLAPARPADVAAAPVTDGVAMASG